MVDLFTLLSLPCSRGTATSNFLGNFPVGAVLVVESKYAASFGGSEFEFARRPHKYSTSNYATCDSDHHQLCDPGHVSTLFVGTST